jgi:hypothetical protein
LGSDVQKRQSKFGQRFFGNREPWRAPHCARQYHFVIAVWRAKEAQSGPREALGANCRQSEQSRLELGLRLGGSTGKI